MLLFQASLNYLRQALIELIEKIYILCYQRSILDDVSSKKTAISLYQHCREDQRMSIGNLA